MNGVHQNIWEMHVIGVWYQRISLNISTGEHKQHETTKSVNCLVWDNTHTQHMCIVQYSELCTTPAVRHFRVDAYLKNASLLFYIRAPTDGKTWNNRPLRQQTEAHTAQQVKYSHYFVSLTSAALLFVKRTFS